MRNAKHGGDLIVVVTIALVTMVTASSSRAAVTFFIDDEQGWLDAVGGQAAVFSFSAENMVLAEEVDVPPVNTTDYGQTLTFLAGNTGLPADFHFVNATPEGNVAWFPGAGGFVAHRSSTTHHDFGISFPGVNNDVFGFAWQLLGHLAGNVDVIRVINKTGNEIGSVGQLPVGNFMLGFVSDVPVGSVVYDDDLNPGGPGLSHVHFATVPEPASLAFAVAGAGLLAARRRS